MSDDLDIPAAGVYRVPRRHGMDPGTKRLAIIAGGLGAALLAVVGVWSLGGHRSSHLPVVEADTRPIRVKPENPGGLQVAGANDEDPFRRCRPAERQARAAARIAGATGAPPEGAGRRASGPPRAPAPVAPPLPPLSRRVRL